MVFQNKAWCMAREERNFRPRHQALANTGMAVLEIRAPTPCRKPQISHSVMIADILGSVVYADRSGATDAARSALDL